MSSSGGTPLTPNPVKQPASILPSGDPPTGKLLAPCETVQSFSEFAQALFGMKAVDDLHGLRKLIFRDIPDRRSAVAEHDLMERLLEAAEQR
jgi:hypothetical protein